MRRALWVLLLLAWGCDSFAPRVERGGDGASEQPPFFGGEPGQMAPKPSPLLNPMLEAAGAPASEPSQDKCAHARENGAIFCEATDTTLEFCEPSLQQVGVGGAPSAAGGQSFAEGGADAGAAGEATSTDAGGATTAGAGGEAGAPGLPNDCSFYGHPPQWVYDELIECVAHCGVSITASDRQIQGACCFIATSVVYGR